MSEQKMLMRKMIDAIRQLQDAVLPLHLRAALALDGRSGGVELYEGGKRSPACWLSDVDLSCIPIHSRNGCLITPQHVVYSRHWAYAVGDVVTFYDKDSNVFERRVAKLYAPAGEESDLGLAKLDAKLPESIVPATHLPSDYATLFRMRDRQSFRHEVPVVFSNHRRQILRGTLFSLHDNKAWATSCRDPELSWSTNKIVPGDSGSPCLLILPRQKAPILLGCWSWAGMAVHVGAFAREISIAALLDGAGIPKEADV